MIDRLATSSEVGQLEGAALDTALLDWASETGYQTWFESIEVARFRADLASDTSAMRRALVDRVRRLHALMSTMDETDGDLDRRLVLDWHVRSPRSESGVGDAMPIAPADGCHRIARRSFDGHTTIGAGEHRLRVRINPTVLDNTRRLMTTRSFTTDTTIELLAEEHAGFAAAVADRHDHPRAMEFVDWVRRAREETT